MCFEGFIFPPLFNRQRLKGDGKNLLVDRSTASKSRALYWYRGIAMPFVALALDVSAYNSDAALSVQSKVMCKDAKIANSYVSRTQS